jgi:beta-lactamase family protein
MRITFIGHASLLIEANGLSIVSDPWWNGPCFGAQWWPYPMPHVEAVRDRRVDYVYVSHGHHDHFHPPTLRLFRGAKVLVAADTELAQSIRGLGFEVIECGDGETDLGSGVRGRIMETYADDTLMAVSAGGETCLNVNDSLHAAPEVIQQKFFRLIRQLYKRPDYVFCGYGTASHFPNCYVLPGKDRAATAAMRQAYFNRAWARIIRELEPRFGFPFAADVAFLDDELFWCNEPVHNAERPTEAFAKLAGTTGPTRVVDIAPGFTVDGGQILRHEVRGRLEADELRRAYGKAIRRVNREGSIDAQTVWELVDTMGANAAKGAEYFAGYPGDYRCLIRIKGASTGIEVAKVGPRVTVTAAEGVAPGTPPYDVIYRTRASYLRQSLVTPYGHEVLFVGSGGIFEFPSVTSVGSGVHREIMTMVKPWTGSRPRRASDKPGGLSTVKRAVKRLLGPSRPDLYDLQTWTVFQGRMTKV